MNNYLQSFKRCEVTKAGNKQRRVLGYLQVIIYNGEWSNYLQ